MCFCMCGLNHKNARVNSNKQIFRKGKCHLTIQIKSFYLIQMFPIKYVLSKSFREVLLLKIYNQQHILFEEVQNMLVAHT
jgi:hypothetical protein